MEDFSNAFWLALFPTSYIIHFVEEFWGGEGYPAYLYRLRGVSMTNRRFVVLQALGFASLIIACIVSLSFQFPQLMISILSGFVICNGVSHTITAIFDRKYGPGLMASLLLWMPLGAASIYFLIGQMSNLRLIVGVAIGLAINGAIALFTIRGGRIK
jgi:hypothetical protein